MIRPAAGDRLSPTVDLLKLTLSFFFGGSAGCGLWGCPTCVQGVIVTEIFLVRVLQKFALDFFYNAVTIVILLSVIVLFFV